MLRVSYVSNRTLCYLCARMQIDLTVEQLRILRDLLLDWKVVYDANISRPVQEALVLRLHSALEDAPKDSDQIDKPQ